MSDQPEHTPNPQELAALELFHQLANLSPDNGDRSIMLTLRLPNGRYIGDVWLSRDDVQALTEGAAAYAAIQESSALSRNDPGEPLLDVDAIDAADVVREIEAFLTDGGIA